MGGGREARLTMEERLLKQTFQQCASSHPSFNPYIWCLREKDHKGMCTNGKEWWWDKS